MHFAEKLLSAQWHISAPHGRARVSSLLSRLRGPVLKDERPAEDTFGDPLPKMQIVGDVAIIPIRGMLLINVPQWIKEIGLDLTDANDICEEIAAAVAHESVRMIVIDADSPGGWSIAGGKLFDAFEAASKKKPLFTWVGDGADCCSAMYNAAAPSVAILSGRHPLAIGSIGSFLAYLDDTEYWAQMGVRWEVFRSGEFKGIGEDALSEEQRAFLQTSVDESGAEIRRNVQKYRTEIDAADLRGQWFSGPESAARGFTAGMVRDFSAAVTKFRGFI